MAADIEVPTWVKVRGLETNAPPVVVVPVRCR